MKGETKREKQVMPQKGASRMKWTEVDKELKELLRLRTDPIAYRRLEKEGDLAGIKDVFRVPQAATFCQVLYMARALRLTVGVTRSDKVGERCMRIHGTQPTTEESMRGEAALFSTTWWKSPEEGYQQQLDTYRIPPGEAVVVAPLSAAGFEPEVVVIFGNPAQLMTLMCGMQKEKYERFNFSFTGEGACADSLARCYVTGKPSLAIPCYGERSIGQVADDELVIAMPPNEIERAISGMKTLSKIAFGFRYPIVSIGGTADVEPGMRMVYPELFKER
jgi:uncharacterized protein (DUF169 family)